MDISASSLPYGLSVRWLGHATSQIVGPQPGQRLLLDPFLAQNPRFPKQLDAEVRAPGAFDALVVTHAHFDHFDDVLPLLKGDPDLKIICQFEIGEWLCAQGIAEERMVALNPGGGTDFNGMRVTMVNAVHSSSVPEDGTPGGSPKALGTPVGYVLRFGNGFTIYYTGDTAVTMDMQIVRDLYRPNLVILPIGDFYTMGAEQAAYALKLLEPDFAIGVHWHTWDSMPPGTPDALEKEMALYSLKTKLIKLQPGDSFA